MPGSTLRLLGGFVLEAGTLARPLRLGRKGQALLACVAMQGSAGLSRGRLTALLWADHGDDEARSALRQCLHLVRRGFGEGFDSLESDGDRLVLRAGAFEVDVHGFESLAARSDIDSMLAAAELYRGDFLDGLDAGADFACWAGVERERLRDIAHGLVTRLSECAEGTTACEATVRLARRLLASDPVHEGCYRALMRLHARAGLRAKALQEWNECRRVLRRELDVEPSAQTAAVIEQLRVDPDAAPAVVLSIPNSRPLTVLAAKPALSPARSGDDPVVFDTLLRGWQLFSLFTEEGNAQARAAFESVIRRVSDHAEALALLGWTHWFDSIGGWSSDPALSYQYASNCASRAVACNRGHPAPHNIQGKVLLWRMQHDAALEELRQSVAIAPGSAYTHFNLGDATMWCGRWEEALAHLDRAFALDANDHGVFLTIQGTALWMSGELRAAHRALSRAITRNPTYAWAHSELSVVQVELGDIAAARASAATARRLNRRFSLSFAEHVLPFRVPEHRRRTMEGWRVAGMPQHEAPGGLPVSPPP